MTRVGLIKNGLACAALWLLMATAASAETAGYREVIVVTGAYRERADFDLPFAIDRIDAAQIQIAQPRINLSETLLRVPGIVAANRQNYAQDLQISARGFGARAAFGVRGLKLIADGVPASTPDGQGQAATFNLDVAERIELLRGPAATVYGSNAGGVLQLFSRDGRGTPRAAVDSAAGSDGLRRAQLTAEGAVDTLGFVLNASRFDTDGYRDHSTVRRDQGFAKFTIEPDADSRASLIYNTLEQDHTEDPLGQNWDGWRADPRSVTANALLYDTRKSIDHQQLGVNYARDFAAGTLELNLYGGRREVLQFLAIPRGTPANETGDGGVVDFDRTFSGAGARWLQHYALAGGELHQVFGLDVNDSRDDRLGFQNYSGAALGVKGALRRDERDRVRSFEPYAQLDWQRARWTVAGGLRYSRFDTRVDDFYLSNGDDGGSRRDEALTGALGVSYAFIDNAQLYANVGRGRETPTLTEQAYAADGNRGFNTALQASTSTQVETGLKWQRSRTRIDLALFAIDTDDEIVVAASSGGRNSYRNAGATRRRGVELGLDSQIASTWRTHVALTWLDAEYADAFNAAGRPIDSGNELPGVPPVTAYAELTWQPRETFFTALETFYRGAVEVEDGNAARAAPAYAVLNWRAQWRQQFGAWALQQTLRVDNLFDRRYIGSVIVNEANARYYEAAPSRSWYAGVGFSYRLD